MIINFKKLLKNKRSFNNALVIINKLNKLL